MVQSFERVKNESPFRLTNDCANLAVRFQGVESQSRGHSCTIGGGGENTGQTTLTPHSSPYITHSAPTVSASVQTTQWNSAATTSSPPFTSSAMTTLEQTIRPESPATTTISWQPTLNNVESTEIGRSSATSHAPTNAAEQYTTTTAPVNQPETTTPTLTVTTHKADSSQTSVADVKTTIQLTSQTQQTHERTFSSSRYAASISSTELQETEIGSAATTVQERTGNSDVVITNRPETPTATTISWQPTLTNVESTEIGRSSATSHLPTSAAEQYTTTTAPLTQPATTTATITVATDQAGGSQTEVSNVPTTVQLTSLEQSLPERTSSSTPYAASASSTTVRITEPRSTATSAQGRTTTSDVTTFSQTIQRHTDLATTLPPQPTLTNEASTAADQNSQEFYELTSFSVRPPTFAQTAFHREHTTATITPVPLTSERSPTSTRFTPSGSSATVQPTELFSTSTTLAPLTTRAEVSTFNPNTHPQTGITTSLSPQQTVTNEQTAASGYAVTTSFESSGKLSTASASRSDSTTVAMVDTGAATFQTEAPSAFTAVQQTSEERPVSGVNPTSARHAVDASSVTAQPTETTSAATTSEPHTTSREVTTSTATTQRTTGNSLYSFRVTLSSCFHFETLLDS
jgi:hypothetical protein